MNWRLARWSWRRWVVVLACSLPVVVLAFTEYLYFFPMTPLFLAGAKDVRVPPKKGAIRLAFVGDVMLADAGRRILKRKGYDYPFGAVRPLLASADLLVGNLEGPIAVRARRNRAKRWSYKMRPEVAAGLHRAGFRAMTLANNHSLDCGAAGMAETRSYLGHNGIVAFGGGRNEQQARRFAVMDVGPVRIALLGYLAPYTLVAGRIQSMAGLAAGPRRAGAALARPEALRRDIAVARSQADLVVVFLHIGGRYQVVPTDFDRELCHEAVEAGAQLVVACGTHIMGPIERYRGVPIFYSLGNFTFGSGNIRARFSLVGLVDLSPGGRWRSAYALPLYTVNWNPYVWFRPRLLRGFMARRVLGRLAGLSARYGTSLMVTSRWARLDRSPRP